MGPTILFTHLKIILLQCFQFSVFSFSNNKFNPNGPIVRIQKVCIKQYRLAEQNVSCVFRGKALPARYSQDTTVSIYTDSSHKAHASLRGKLSRETPARILLASLASVFTLSLSSTQPLQSNPTINTGYTRLKIITIKFGTE